MVTTKKTRLVKWHKFTSPAGSSVPHPFLAGKIACHVVQIGPANGEIKLDLNKVDPSFAKLTPHGKRIFAHGAKQKLSDGTAGKSPAESYTIMRDMSKLLETGQWNTPRDSAAARKLNDLATDMAVAKFTISFTEDNRNAMVALVSSAPDEKIKGWSDAPQVAKARADREFAEVEVERKRLAELAKSDTSELDF